MWKDGGAEVKTTDFENKNQEAYKNPAGAGEEQEQQC